MATIRLTDAVAKTLPAPPKGSKVYYDDLVSLFGLRVTARGTRAFVYNYRTRATGVERRITIGRISSWSTGAARAEAKRLRRLIDQGEDPRGDIAAAREAPTVTDLIARFDAEHIGPRLRKSTARTYRSIIHKHIAPYFGAHTKVADVTFADVDALHRKITKAGSTYAANRCIAILSKMFGLAKRWGWRADSPVHSVERNPEVKRKRYLSGDEMAALTKALAAYPNPQVPNIVRLLLLTGARSGEVMAMRWADIDLGAGIWSKAASTTKQKADHVAPLSGPARQLLSELRTKQTAKGRALSDWVFPSTNNDTGHVITIEGAWPTICKAAGISNLRVHDLRHTFASTLASAGATLPLIGALLGHSNPTTTARYAHLFQDPQRAAVERVAAIIDAAGKGDAKEPVPFPKGGRRGR